MRKSNTQSEVRIAMILAAGYGTRMGDLTGDIPKPLLPLNGKRIIEVVLHKLARQGFTRAVVNLHYLPQKMREALGAGSRFGLEIKYSEEPELLGSGGGIANAEPYFDGETILAVNADVLCAIDIRELLAFHQRFDPLATMAVLPSRNNRDYSLALFDAENNLAGFLKKNDAIPSPYQSAIFTGYQILTPQARAYLKPVNQSVIEELYKRALKEGKTVKVYPFSGRWIDVGTKEFYHSLVEKVRSGEEDPEAFMK